MEDRADESPRLRKIVRLKDGPKYTGLGETQTNELIREGFIRQPFPLSPGGRARGWFEDELAEDIANMQRLAAERDGGTGGKA
jgi:hypothetical protein